MKALLVIFLGAIVVLFAGLGKPERKISWLAILFLLVGLILLPFEYLRESAPAWEARIISPNMIYFTPSSLLFSGVLIIATLLILLLFRDKVQMGPDILGLIMFSLCGGMMMTAYTHLVMLFLGIEVMSIPLYVLAGSRKKHLPGNEAAIKYFLMGAFSTAVFLLGCAFLYGGTGSLELIGILRSVVDMQGVQSVSALVKVGVLLIMCGMAFKISAAPFHFWSPDVYEGSPNRIMVFMATVVKIAAFAAIVRIFYSAFGTVDAFWGKPLAWIAAASILIGNLAALRQKGIKRTMAYSSIAHSGYMLMAVLSAPTDGFWALLLYSAGYAAASITLFYILNKVMESGKNDSFESMNGLGQANRFQGIAMLIALFSMAGIPITAGFAGKYLLFSGAFHAHAWLEIVALVGSAISIGYYFRILKSVWFTPGEGVTLNSSLGEKVLLGLTLIIILGLGVAPSLITGLQYFKVGY